MTLPLRVDCQMLLPDVMDSVGVRVSGAASHIELSGVALDSRVVQPGDLFIALTATRDGHVFIDHAVGKGAKAVLVSVPSQHDFGVSKTSDVAFVQVDNTQAALEKLAASRRRLWAGYVVAISGSNGKTSTKEMTSAILAQAQATHKSPGTWNNHLGVPLTLLGAKPSDKVAVLEMGMNHPGELRRLCQLAQPDIAILTNIGRAHIEAFGSLDGIAKAKAELFEAMPVAGTLVVNNDDPRIVAIADRLSTRTIGVSQHDKDCDVAVLKQLPLEGWGYQLTVKYGDSEAQVRTPFPGDHNVANLLCALGAALAVKVPASCLQAGVDHIELPDMRLQRIVLANDSELIVDCYNANPDSTLVALQVAANTNKQHKVAVLADMLELGVHAARAHQEVGFCVAKLAYDQLFCVGQYCHDLAQGAIQGGMNKQHIHCAEHSQDIQTVIEQCWRPDSVVVIKGSRAMKLERVVSFMLERFKEK